jgi:hypothetical protein
MRLLVLDPREPKRDFDSGAVTVKRGAPLAPEPGDPPVVARLVVEIRSDGTRTVARGAVEDVLTGQTATIDARGTTPLALAGALAKSLFSIPSLARQAVTTAVAKRLGLGKKSAP